MATLEAVQAKIRALQAQAETLIAKKSSAALKAIHDLMSKHGLTSADIDKYAGQKKGGRKPGVTAVTKVDALAAKYRDPNTGNTWSGHGRAPSWIAGAKDRSKFLIERSVAASASKVSGELGPARKGQRKGPQPAKYRDPKTGRTWSGRGPAPAWLASAKDRARFSIEVGGAPVDGPGEKDKAESKKAGAVNKGAVASKSGPARKVAARKVV